MVIQKTEEDPRVALAHRANITYKDTMVGSEGWRGQGNLTQRLRAAPEQYRYVRFYL